MAAKDRIYRVVQKVVTPETNEVQFIIRLVRAQNNVQAENFVAQDTIKAGVPTQDELIELSQSGVKIEQARPATADLPL